MPNGFIGRAAAKYLSQVSNAHSNAVSATSQTPSHAPPGPRVRRLPFTPDDAFNGNFSTGRGDSSNIVVNQEEYEAACRTIDQIDDKIGECLYRTAREIEHMCQTSFILPAAVPRCMNISDSVKNSLNEFRTVTHDAIVEIRRFAREIDEIG